MGYRKTRTTTTKYDVTDLQIDIWPYDENWRRIRAKHKNTMEKCHKCNREFQDGERMTLAMMRSQRNQMLCKLCAEELAEEYPEICVYRKKMEE